MYAWVQFYKVTKYKSANLIDLLLNNLLGFVLEVGLNRQKKSVVNYSQKQKVDSENRAWNNLQQMVLETQHKELCCLHHFTHTSTHKHQEEAAPWGEMFFTVKKQQLKTVDVGGKMLQLDPMWQKAETFLFHPQSHISNSA